VVHAVDDLVRHRFLICDDTQNIVTRLLQAGLTAGVPAPTEFDNPLPPDPVPACLGHHGHYYHGDHHDYDHDHDHNRD
jgi:hypothetical protein